MQWVFPSARKTPEAATSGPAVLFSRDFPRNSLAHEYVVVWQSNAFRRSPALAGRQEEFDSSGSLDFLPL